MRGPIAYIRELAADVRDERRQLDLERAVRHRKEGRYDRSRAIVERVLRRRPDDPVAQRQLNQLESAPYVDRMNDLFDEGQTDEAEAFLQEALRRLPDNADLHAWMASLNANREQFDVAATYARRATQLAPTQPVILLMAASAARWAEPDAARDYVERVKRLTAGITDTEQFPLRLELINLDGHLAFDEGHRDEGIALLEQAFAGDPTAPTFGADLAQAYVAVGRTADALATIGVALPHRPEDERLARLRAEAAEYRGSR